MNQHETLTTADNGQALGALMAQLACVRLHLERRLDEVRSRLCTEFVTGRDLPEHCVADGIRLHTELDNLGWVLEMLPDLSVPPCERGQQGAVMTVESLSSRISQARSLFQQRIADITSSLARGDLSLAQVPRLGEDALVELNTTVAVLHDVLQMVPDGSAQVHEYAFDCSLKAAIRVKAKSGAAAEAAIRSVMDAADCNAGAWPDGRPVRFEASVNDSPLRLFEVDGAMVVQEGVRADPEGARLFFKELLDSVETLTGVAEQYGARTLADLTYLQNAIANGSGIDHYVGESSVLDVVEHLPSAGRWMKYIEVREPEAKYEDSSVG